MKKTSLLTAVAFTFLSCVSSHSNVTKKATTPAAPAAWPGDLRDPNLTDPSPVQNAPAGPTTSPVYQKSTTPPKELTAADIKAIIERLPVLLADVQDLGGFNVREKTERPPKVKEVKEVFPPKDDPEKPPSTPPVILKEPLKVLRYAPVGEIPWAAEITVTFSQPMIEITTLEQIEKQPIPVKMTPTVPGRWRWAGAKTLIFEPTKEDGPARLPLATNFTVEIPAGVKSSLGNALEKAEKFTFSTPPIGLSSLYPYSGQMLGWQPNFYLLFNQKMDPASVLKVINMKGPSGNIEMELLSDEDLKKDATAQSYKNTSAYDGMWMVIRPKAKLPKDAALTMTIGPGVPSKEGPRLSAALGTYTYRTPAPLKYVSVTCSYQGLEGCHPQGSFYLLFNNALDATKFKKEMVTIEPALENAVVTPSGQYLYISGTFKEKTKYTVKVSKDLPDMYEQVLGKEESASMQFGKVPPPPKYVEAETPMWISADLQGFLVADPAGKPIYTVSSQGLSSIDVSLYEVDPKDWADYTAFTNTYYTKKKPKKPGKEVWSDKIKISKTKEVTKTEIDLSPALNKKGLGNVFVYVWSRELDKKEAEYQKQQSKSYGYNYDYYYDYYSRPNAWINFTKIGIDISNDHSDLSVFVNSLTEGKPLEGVDVSLDKTTRSTDKKGIASFPAMAASMVVATKDGDLAMWPTYIQPTYENGVYLSWYVFDDRKMYRPSEEVHMKGWLRQISYKEGGDTTLPTFKEKKLSYAVRDSAGLEIAKGDSTLDETYGFDFTFKLPTTPNLGTAYIYITSPDNTISPNSYSHYIQIQEFRRAEYEVIASPPPGDQFIDGDANVSAVAKYYSGSPLPNSDVAWNVSAYQTSFAPPGHDGYYFGTFTPWWTYYGYGYRRGYYGGYDDYGYGYGGYYGGYYGYQPQQTFSFTGKTDVAGQHSIKFNVKGSEPPRAFSVTATATVTDVNRQAWSSTTSFLVHPSAYYVGLKTEKYFVQQGDELKVQSLVVDTNGKEIEGVIYEVKAKLPKWVLENGQYVQKDDNVQNCRVTSKKGGDTCTFKTKDGAGQYQITAEVYDQKERKNQSQLTLWVAGQITEDYREYGVNQDQVTLIQDKKEYKVGDTAEILVQAPFAPAEGTLTYRRSGILKTERISISAKGTYTIKVPIEEKYVPNLFVQVDLVGVRLRMNQKGEPDPKLPPKPAYASGQVSLPVSLETRTLTVAVKPSKTVAKPGEKTSIQVQVKDSKGANVSGGSVALVVVDEAVLALTAYKLIDPLTLFYPQRGEDSVDYHSRQLVRLVEVANLALEGQGMMGGANTATPTAPPSDPSAKPSSKAPSKASRMETDSMESAAPAAADMSDSFGSAAGGGASGYRAAPPPPPIDLRSDFNPLALFVPSAKTNKDGVATIDFTLPDNLTRYRVMAVAVSGENRSGLGESNITARKPLMVRPSPPRFMNWGDEALLPIVVENQTDNVVKANIIARGTNTTLETAQGFEIELNAHERREVSFKMSPTKVGTARFQIAVTSDIFSDASEFTLPIYTPATSEAFATYGFVDKGAVAQPIAQPKDVFDQFGGVKVTTSSTALSELVDAVNYVYLYPYGCAEQISSKILTIAAMRDVMLAFKVPGFPAASEIESSMNEMFKNLRSKQKYDGGFGFWDKDPESYPYVSVHVGHALALAQNKGYKVPSDMMTRLQSYLKNIESYYPRWYYYEVDTALSAYALFVRNLMGDKDAAKAVKLISSNGGVEKLSMETIGWLMPVLKGASTGKTELEAMRKLIKSRATETAKDAHFITSYKDQGYLMLYSDRRTDAILLDALINDEPSNDLIVKLVSGLLGSRNNGRWYNTQENAFSLIALDKYFNTFEKATPNFVAKAWLGDTYAGQVEYKGRSTETHSTEIPMTEVKKGNVKKDLIISKEGEGRLYYRVGMSYAPKNLRLSSMDYGFTVGRTYESTSGQKDVWKDKDGIWHAKAGATIRVKVSMATKSVRYHVALVDPLAAGFEALNPSLLNIAPIPSDPSARGYWYGNWFQHQNLRDERAEAFTTYLYEGVYEYSYTVRATTLGTFVVPPAKAEEMYSPEVFGRSATDIVIVEE